MARLYLEDLVVGQGFVKVRSTTLNQHREAVRVLVINLLVQSRQPAPALFA